jgi:hypothetical protein
MERLKLFKKWNGHAQHGYDLSETFNESTKLEGRDIDIAFILSGRNRGKSFTISCECLADAWYDNKQFGYIRRHDATVYDTEAYFADKTDFIKDMTDGAFDHITRSKGKLYFAKYVTDVDSGEQRNVLGKEAGNFFALSRNSAYKSLQYPQIHNLFYEEVMADEAYLQGEPSKLLNLISTIKRNKDDFKVYLISNLISPVSPYSVEWGINIGSLKPDNINLVKLYLGSYDTSGEEDFLVIACHYLKDKNDLSKEDLKKKRNRVRTGIASNRWDEKTLYPVMPYNFLKGKAERLDRCVFEWDDIMFLVDILEVPDNINLVHRDEVEANKETMPIMYIQRKTSQPFNDTRLYTNNPERFGPYVSRGFQIIYKIDKVIEILAKRGYFFGADNLTVNSFKTCFDNLRSYKLTF